MKFLPFLYPPHNSTGYYDFVLVVRVYVCLFVFSSPDDNLNKYQWISTKLIIALILWRSSLGLLIGKFCQFLTVICLPDDSGRVLSFQVFIYLFTKETTFVTSCLLSCTPSPFWKGSSLKGKNLLPNYFILEQTPFQKEGKTILAELTPLNLHSYSSRRMYAYYCTDTLFQTVVPL